MKKYYLSNRKKNNEVFSMQISRYLLSLIIVLNEIFYAFSISKELGKLRIAFSISEKVENSNEIIEECKK